MSASLFMQSQTLEERFWERVLLTEFDSCCPYIGTYGIKPGSRGMFKYNGRRYSPARLSFFLVNGYWPDQVLHGCDNPSCCNAFNESHVHDGSQSDNMQEMHNRIRHHRNIGELNGQVKLSSLDVSEIRRRSNEPRLVLAREFGVRR